MIEFILIIGLIIVVGDFIVAMCALIAWAIRDRNYVTAVVFSCLNILLVAGCVMLINLAPVYYAKIGKAPITSEQNALQ